MKVLFVLPEYPPDSGGGIASFYRDLLPALREAGSEVSVLKGSAFVHGSAGYELDGVRVSVLETERYQKWLGLFAHFAMFPDLRSHLAAGFALKEQADESEGYDVVEVTDWGLLFLPWILGARERVLVQLHGSSGQIAYHETVNGREAEGLFTLLLEKTALSVAPGLSSYSHANVNWWEALLQRSVTYAPPPVKTSGPFVPPTQANGRWLTVGRVQHWKGPHIACDAWNRLGKGAPTLEWLGRDTICGATGELTGAYLEKQFPKIWGNLIRPLGPADPEQVKSRMSTAKAVLVPSTWDVFNIVTAEAMALGKPVVVSDGAGAADVIQHGVNGFVFPRTDAAALADLVRQVEDMSSSSLQEVGRAAATTVRKTLSPDKVAREKLAIYGNLTHGKDNLWLRDWISPSTGRNPAGFLNALPLKDLSVYVLNRGVSKILGQRIH